MCSYVHELSTHYVYSSAFVCGRMIFYNVMQLQFSGWRRGGGHLVPVWHQSHTNLVTAWYEYGTNLVPLWYKPGHNRVLVG
jgi:hypothetical protein